MRRALVSIVFVAVIALPGFAQGQKQQAMPAIDEVIKAVRSDLQNTRSQIIAKNVPLTSEQAAQFWPVYEKYQAEQNGIMEAQIKGIHQYVEGYETLDDATALSLMKAHLERDAQMNALRQRWLPEFQKVLPAKLAVRVMQIDRRLSLAYQMQLASEIPLAH